MQLSIREMKLEEVGIIVNYFYGATPEHLEILGVDPSRLPPPEKWLAHYRHQYSTPIEKRKSFQVVWNLDEVPFGFSTADKIIFGKEAHMHLHILDAAQRQGGNGTACVKETVRIYFEALKVERLYCEPNAFNVAPNRTLQRAGFKYLKTYKTVPGPLNYHQAVTRWMLER